MKKKQTHKAQAQRTIRERIRDAAGSLKERAKNMNSEEKTAKAEQPVPEQEAAQQEAVQAEDAQQEEEQQLPAAEELAAQLEKMTAERDEYLDLAQRKQAEFANYRRRNEGVRREAYDDGRRDTIEKMLPVLDNLERALAAAAGEENALASGVDMVLRQMRDVLSKMGVEEIDPQGQPFDAAFMNAVMQGTAEEGEPGTVCLVLQKGYKLGERVIRHAMVKVVAG